MSSYVLLAFPWLLFCISTGYGFNFNPISYVYNNNIKSGNFIGTSHHRLQTKPQVDILGPKSPNLQRPMMATAIKPQAHWSNPGHFWKLLGFPWPTMSSARMPIPSTPRPLQNPSSIQSWNRPAMPPISTAIRYPIQISGQIPQTVHSPNHGQFWNHLAVPWPKPEWPTISSVKVPIPSTRTPMKIPPSITIQSWNKPELSLDGTAISSQTSQIASRPQHLLHRFHHPLQAYSVHLVPTRNVRPHMPLSSLTSYPNPFVLGHNILPRPLTSSVSTTPKPACSATIISETSSNVTSTGLALTPLAIIPEIATTPPISKYGINPASTKGARHYSPKVGFSIDGWIPLTRVY